MRIRVAGRVFAPLILALSACGHDEPVPTPRIVDLESLAARCPLRGEEGSEAFHDLLYLRDEPTVAAIPTLAQVLRDHVGSGRIHRYAAAQALFTINTEESREILESEATRADFDSLLAFDYAFGWKMAPGVRDPFLLQYVLRDVGEAPSLTLRRVSDARDRLVFDVELANATDAALELAHLAERAGELLVFRAVGGHVASTVRTRSICPDLLIKPLLLAPGESRTIRIEVELKVADRYLEARGHAEGRIAGHANGFWYFLSGPGEYDVFARWNSRLGRSISAPVRVTVPDPE